MHYSLAESKWPLFRFFFQMVGIATSPTSSLDVMSELGGMVEEEDQSHLTQVVVGIPVEERDDEEGREAMNIGVSLVTEEEPQKILRQVRHILRCPELVGLY